MSSDCEWCLLIVNDAQWLWMMRINWEWCLLIVNNDYDAEWCLLMSADCEWCLLIVVFVVATFSVRREVLEWIKRPSPKLGDGLLNEFRIVNLSFSAMKLATISILTNLKMIDAFPRENLEMKFPPQNSPPKILPALPFPHF